MRKSLFCFTIVAFFLLAHGDFYQYRACAQDAARPFAAIVPGARVAIIGDSITEQKLYSKFMEAYLLACTGVPDVHVFQLGWSGEQAGGFAARMENDMTVFGPTVATLCYGMNDGSYQPYNDEIGKRYETNMRKILEKMDSLGVKSVVVGSPGAVDTNFFRPGQNMGDRPAHIAYNDNLTHLRDIDRSLAKEKHLLFADVHAAMFDAMTQAQAALGKEYDVCGKDGFHPGNNGQLLMAFAFLKGLGVDGKIGEVNVDLKGTNSVTNGHKLLSGSAGKLELESTRWPFCFEGDEKSSNSTRSILPFTSFNADLNQFVLKVKGLDTANATIKWGNAEKKFTREQLASGINLAAEFSESPFDVSFKKLIEAIAVKQNFETYMIKMIITDFRSVPREVAENAELKQAIASFRKSLLSSQQQLELAVQKTLVPVKHTLQITPAS
ncbi:MAG: SGNH/GDSL hydrolase family protein [Planctomycetota bacterium]|nr:SGNH/GDSL hydrolase family protein [Planctomycetota bacterium]